MPNTKASSFSMTCNLLSQFMKEKGRSFGDLGLANSIGKNDTCRVPTTMNLLPGSDISENDTKSMDLFPQVTGFGIQTPAKEYNRDAEKKPLTIFFGGKVLVFDNFPADKANDLMMLAGNGSGVTKNTTFAIPAPAPTVTVGDPKTLSANTLPPVQAALPPRPTQAIISDLPIARKASLHRFLEKRKDRVNANAPYQLNKPKETPKEENQPWLGLSSEGSR